jgi:hypothetical protein
MDPKNLKALTAKLRELSDLHRELAAMACHVPDTYQVYEHVKKSLAYESEIRRVQMRYGRNGG